MTSKGSKTSGQAATADASAALHVSDWNDFIGHEGPQASIRQAIGSSRLASTFLLVGPESVGKRTFARLVAKTLFCKRNDPSQWQPCGRCDGCVQVDASTHPDLVEVNKPADRSFIPLELLIGDRESRNQEGLCHQIHLSPMEGRRKVVILDDADYLNEEGSNCLLKTLEEPPPDSLLFLVGSVEQRQLPTIRSRCQILRFTSFTIPQATQLMLRLGMASSHEAATQLAMLVQGDIARARFWLEPDAQAFRQQLWDQCGETPLDAINLSKSVETFVGHAGEDAAIRRGRIRESLRVAIERFRSDLRARLHDSRGSAILRMRIERSIEAETQVDRNANQSALLNAWAADLQAASRSSAS
jgi:DNA polymerase III subunit delta'